MLALDSCLSHHYSDECIVILGSILFPRELYDYIRAEYRQIAIIVGSTTIGRVGILSV